MIKLQQFYIYKFKSDRLKRSNYNINITIDEARDNKELIELADSQFLRTIRKVTNHPFDEELLKQAKFKHNFDEIDRLLFIPDYISVVIEKKNQYKNIIKKGIIVNGTKYKRFSCSASNARVNTVFFINENIDERVYDILKNGARDIKITKAKFNSYFALLSSATYKVRNPKVCVIPDFVENLNHTFDFVEDDKSIVRKNVEIKDYPPFDGMGIIDISLSKEWAEDLEIDYVPSAFCIRNAYIKGMVCTMPLKEWFNEHNITNTIKDLWGKIHNINDINMILTESQFKLWSAYESYDEYEKYCNQNDISWGISRATPKEDKKVASTNYQFLQVLNLTDEQIKGLCKPTIDWINNIMGNDIQTTLLCLLGKEIEWNNIDDKSIKALILNNNLIKDQYIQNKIIRNINKKIRQAYSGKLIVDGNFQVMISDPVALLEYISGMEVKGLLSNKEHYSDFWNKKNISTVVACRSPLTWKSEVNKLNLIKNENTEKWYRYLNSGIIYNIYGDDTMRHADSDFDFDIVFSTNKQEFIDGISEDEKPITYNKATVNKETINRDTLWEADLDAFDSRIGFITNCDTTMYEMITQYEFDSPEYKELDYRLRYSRKLQGDEIDRAKGVKVDKFPQHWTKKEFCSNDLDKKLLVDKRPYFMRYVYNNYDKKFKQFIEKIDNISQAEYGCSHDRNTNAKFKELFNKSTLLHTKGTMNRICEYLETQIKEVIRYERTTPDYIIDEFKVYGEYKEEYVDVLKQLLKEYKMKRKSIRENDDFTLKEEQAKLHTEKINLKKRIFSLGDINDVTYTAITEFYKGKVQENKEFIWDVFGDIIAKNMIKNVKKPIYIPVKDDNGSIEYLGEKYSKKELDI